MSRILKSLRDRRDVARNSRDLQRMINSAGSRTMRDELIEMTSPASTLR